MVPAVEYLWQPLCFSTEPAPSTSPPIPQCCKEPLDGVQAFSAILWQREVADEEVQVGYSGLFSCSLSLSFFALGMWQAGLEKQLEGCFAGMPFIGGGRCCACKLHAQLVIRMHLVL